MQKALVPTVQQLLSLDNNRLYIWSGFTSAYLFIILPVWDIQMDIL